MGHLNIPGGQKIQQFKISQFKGADLSESGVNISETRSPDCPNMIRETVGKVGKWTGFETVKSYLGKKINGVFFFDEAGVKSRIVHAGKYLYLDGGESADKVLCSAMADNISSAAQLSGRLCIFDGVKLRVVRKNGGALECVTGESLAKTPVIMISRSPSGGGTAYEAVNLISARREVDFLADGTSKVYQLPDAALDAAAVTVRKLNDDGSYASMSEGSGFSVDRTAGRVTFTSAPAAPAVAGKDNVFITYSKTVSGYADRINKCDVCTLYGTNGGRDRLFVTGNSDFANRDFYCGVDDPTYFGDLNYSVIGSDGAAIVGYTIVGDELATHIDKSEDGTTTVLRRGEITDGTAVFRLTGGYQGEGAVAKHAFAMLAAEPVYLSKNGVFSITTADYSGERYGQNRSFYIDKLLTRQDLKNAYAAVLDGFYFLAAGEYLFALDSLQVSKQKETPYSNRLYEGYYRTGINARVLWEQDNELWFGTADGKLKRFKTNRELLSTWNDDGAAVCARWTTPEFYGVDFYSKKKFKKIAVMLGAAIATGCRIWALYDGEKELVLDYDGTARYFTYSQFQYSKLTYKTDQTPQMLIEKLSGIKPDGRKIQFMFENDLLNEPFSLHMSTVEYTETR